MKNRCCLLSEILSIVAGTGFALCCVLCLVNESLYNHFGVAFNYLFASAAMFVNAYGNSLLKTQDEEN